MNFTYLHTPSFVATALHLMTCIEVPVHIFGTYCILLRTPSSMSSVKWSMLNLHFWSISMDLGVSLLTSPFVLFPAIAGFPLGVLKEFGVSTLAQIYLIVSLFATVGAAIVTIFENRFYLLFGEHTWWRKVRAPFLAMNYVLAFTFFIPPCFQIPEQRYALEQIYQQLPELPSHVYQSPVFVLTLDITYSFVSVFCVTVFMIIEVLVFKSLLFRNMKKRVNQMTLSQKTFDLQKKFLRAVHIQIYTPLVILIFPLSYIGLCIFFSLYNQAFNNICFVTLAFHGLSSTVVMLLIHRPYRDVCIEIFCLRIAKASNKTSPIAFSRRNTELSGGVSHFVKNNNNVL